MIYLVYSSIATYSLAESELDAIIARSRFHNSKNGITGLLLYHEGRFIQLLEGEEEHVRRCYSRILQDSRHHDIIKLIEKPLRYRYFEDWLMAFEQIDPLTPKEEGFSHFLSRPYCSMELGDDLNEGIFLLLSFKKQALAQSHHLMPFHSVS